MKPILAIVLFSFTICCYGQQLTLFENRVTSMNEEKYFNDMQRQVLQKNQDSIISAISIIYDLKKHNSEKYCSDLLQPYLNKIFDDAFFDLKNSLSGTWNSEALGTNWGGKIINPNKQVKFQNNQILIFQNDSLIRNTTFKIIPRLIRQNGLTSQYFILTFSDNTEEWRIDLLQNGALVPFHGKATKPYLLFNYDKHCVCGCAQDLYSQRANNRFQ